MRSLPAGAPGRRAREPRRGGRRQPLPRRRGAGAQGASRGCATKPACARRTSGCSSRRRPRESGTTRVRATRDWVLFHRRRRSSCDCCPGAAVVAPPRRYRVYHTVLTDDPSPEEIREALAGSEGPEEGLQLLGIAPEFEGGTDDAAHRARRAAGRLAGRWRPARSLYYGAIAGAGEGAGDPDALLDGRLDRIASAVASVTPEYPGAVFDVLGRPPSWLSAGTADGVVVLLTYQPRVATECLRVFGLPDQGMMSFVLSDRIPQGGLGADLARYRSLGTVELPGGRRDAGGRLAAEGGRRVEGGRLPGRLHGRARRGGPPGERRSRRHRRGARRRDRGGAGRTAHGRALRLAGAAVRPVRRHRPAGAGPAARSWPSPASP